MNIIVLICSWITLILVAIGFILGPFLIGKLRDNPYHTAGDYVLSLLTYAVLIIMIGRIFGWW
jgi:hypothetical protein